MFKKHPVIFVLLAAVCFLVMGNSECNMEGSNQKAVNVVSQIQAEDQQQTAANFKRLYRSNPPPALSNSVERSNLVSRLQRFNVPTKISYIYLVSYGKVMAFYPVKGKVSSVNSMLTCTKQLVDDGDGRYQGRSNVHVVDSPDLDGSYGSNGDAIFFFTTEDVYVEWNGDYMLCDEPLQLSTPPALTYIKKAG